MIRAVNVDKMQQYFAESIEGTAIVHLQGGLFEAHARDEAGWDEEAGHKQMWFAARDIAFERPVTEDKTQTMLRRWASFPPMAKRRRRKTSAATRGAAPFPDLDPSSR